MPKFIIEQIALNPYNPNIARGFLGKLGLTDWVHDHVKATGQVFGEHGKNEADLLFNYQATSGKALELEVLNYTDGPNWAMHGRTSSVCHIGMHVTEEQLAEFDMVMRSYGVTIAQSVNTESHTNEAIKDTRRYKYVIYDTRNLIGVDLKFIVKAPGAMISYPFNDVLAQSNEAIEKGGVVYQKLECDGCGNILTMDVPDTFYTSGSCDKCGAVTDIRKKGCNTMVVFGKRIGEA